MKVLIFDTETTGLPKNWSTNRGYWWKDYPYIIQLSWIMYDTEENKILSEKDYIIKLPENIEIPKESTQIHNIDETTMRRYGVNIKDVLNEFNIILKNCNLLVAHNISFDKNMISAENCRNTMIDPFIKCNINEYCTMKNNINFCKIPFKTKYISTKDGIIKKNNYKYPKLEELHFKLFNSIPKNLHNSLYDCYVTLRCFYKQHCQNDILDKNEYINQIFINKLL